MTQKVQQTVPTAHVAALPAKHSHARIGSLIGWSFVIVSAFAVLSLVAAYSSADGETSTFQEKLKSRLAQVATLSLVDSAPENNDVTILATGDILPARYVEKRMRELKDYTHPFQKVAGFLKSADITFGNLESPLLPGKNVPTGSMTFRGDLEAVQGLLFAGYDVISLANNHTMNYQVPGLTSTIQTLKKAELATVGAGKNLDAAHTPAIFEVKGKKIAFYAYNDQTIPPGFHGEAKANTPGIAKMDLETVKNDVKYALSPDGHGVDAVIVSMHAGREYTHKPTKFQQDFAHAAIDAGAKAVIGAHPHWVQPVEHYGNGVIFYSLGNFVFDQFFDPDVQTGMIAKIVLGDEGKVTAEWFPVKIDKTVPRILEGEEKAQELKRLGF